MHRNCPVRLDNGFPNGRQYHCARGVLRSKRPRLTWSLIVLFWIFAKACSIRVSMSCNHLDGKEKPFEGNLPPIVCIAGMGR